MTREEYRAWAERQPSGRFERITGVIVAMAPEWAAHTVANDRLGTHYAAVQDARLPCEVFADGMTIEVGESDYGPDAGLSPG